MPKITVKDLSTETLNETIEYLIRIRDEGRLVYFGDWRLSEDNIAHMDTLSFTLYVGAVKNHD